MRKNQLTVQELEDLIQQYTSEARKLAFQLQQAEGIVADLEKQYEKAATAEPKAAEPKIEGPKAKAKAKAEKPAKTGKKRGRPRKEEAETATPEVAAAETAPRKKRGRPKKSETPAKTGKKASRKLRSAEDEASKPKGYRLSDWDLFILNSLKRANKVLINSDFMDKALNRVKKEKMDLDEIALRGKLNRSIHKLANRRGDLVKVDYPGKGFAYGLPEWTDEEGNIRDEFMALDN